MAAALQLVEAGQSVVLVETRTYLAREICAVLAPWVSAERLPARGLAADLVKAARKDEGRAGEPEIALHMDEVKRYLENRLLEAGVQILYASLPVGLAYEEGRIIGLIVGNKSGRQIVAGKLLVDSTETALLARLAGFTMEPVNNIMWGRNMEFDNLGDCVSGKIDAPEEFGLEKNSFILHPGYRKGLGVIACHFRLPGLPEGLPGLNSCRNRDTRPIDAPGSMVGASCTWFWKSLSGECRL